MFSKQNEKPKITGPWNFGVDNTDHRLGVAVTDTHGVIAIGSEDHDPLFATREQFGQLLHGAREGALDSVIKTLAP